MMALVATVGAADANSYGTLAEAELYFADRLFTDAWTALTDPQKTGLLIWATRIAENRVSNEWPKEQLPNDATIRILSELKGDDDCFVVWTGSPATEVQALAWPRTNMRNRNGFTLADDVIPDRLKEWQFEIALKYAAEDRTVENSAGAQGLVGLKAGPVDLKWAQGAPNPKLISGAVMQSLVPSWWYAFQLDYSTQIKLVTL
jgi:hypothetical protein